MLTPVSGRTFAALVSPQDTVKVPCCVARTSLPPPIVNACSPSRHVDPTRIKPFVSFTQTFVPPEDVICVAAKATPAPSVSTTMTAAVTFVVQRMVNLQFVARQSASTVRQKSPVRDVRDANRPYVMGVIRGFLRGPLRGDGGTVQPRSYRCQ